MAKTATTAELRKMSAADLRKEIADKRAEVAKLRMTVALGAEKDTAKFRREKKEIARMLTILGEVESAATPLKTASKTSTVPAPARRAAKAKAGSSSTAA